MATLANIFSESNIYTYDFFICIYLISILVFPVLQEDPNFYLQCKFRGHVLHRSFFPVYAVNDSLSSDYNYSRHRHIFRL